MTITLFLCSLIVPLTMLVFGIWMLRRPPKEVGGVFGYRTRRSMKNEETWKYAHNICGKVWTSVGLVLLILSVIESIVFWRSGEISKRTTALTMAQVVVLVVTTFPVEHALKRKFDDDGNPKE